MTNTWRIGGSPVDGAVVGVAPPPPAVEDVVVAEDDDPEEQAVVTTARAPTRTRAAIRTDRRGPRATVDTV
jgi:hypothetical protein